jgi:hypothetical protein
VKAVTLDQAGERQRGFLVLREWIRDASGTSHAPGVYKEVERKDEETGEKVRGWSWFCSRLEIAADTRTSPASSGAGWCG